MLLGSFRVVGFMVIQSEVMDSVDMSQSTMLEFNGSVMELRGCVVVTLASHSSQA